MTSLSYQGFCEAYQFVEKQTPLTFPIEFVKLPGGRFLTFSPMAVIVVPNSQSENHFETACVLFHEFGHWLDFWSWMKGASKADELDQRITNVLRDSAELSAEELREYFTRRSPLGENVRLYHQKLQNEGIVPGKRELDKKAVVVHEEKAWGFGLNGCTIQGKRYEGFFQFAQQSTYFGNTEDAVKDYRQVERQGIASYKKQH